MTTKRTALLIGAGVVAAAIGVWQLGATLGGTPVAQGATGACDPALSTLTTNHASVPAGGNFSATLTATCLGQSGPIAGRLIVLQASGGSSTITPPSAVTDANGVATFTVLDKDVPPPGEGYSITYTAVDQAADVLFDQVVTIGFYYCDCGGPSVPAAAIGGIAFAGAATGALVVWQIRRRRRSARHEGAVT